MLLLLVYLAFLMWRARYVLAAIQVDAAFCTIKNRPTILTYVLASGLTSDMAVMLCRESGI